MTFVGPHEARLILEAVALPSLMREHASTREAISAVPADQMKFSPAAGARTAGELVRHLAGTELRYLSGAISGEFAGFEAELAAAEGPRGVAECYAARFRSALDFIRDMSGDELLCELDYKGFVKMPALGFIQFATLHSIHHRGQLSVYLRSMGVAVPPIYG